MRNSCNQPSVNTIAIICANTLLLLSACASNGTTSLNNAATGGSTTVAPGAGGSTMIAPAAGGTVTGTPAINAGGNTSMVTTVVTSSGGATTARTTASNLGGATVVSVGGATVVGAGGVATATGGATASGGTVATSAATTSTGAIACFPLTSALITDFTYSAATVPATSTSEVTFGDFTTTFSGGTTSWPSATLTSDVTASNWHLSGQIADYTGFGLYLNAKGGACSLVDASGYSGISFKISGDALPTGRTLTMQVGTAADQISSAWLVAAGDTNVTPNFGRCTPASANRYDGSCGTPSVAIPITSTPTVVTVKWADLVGGKPATTVNPAEITSISWFFAWGGATDTAYPVNITIDDLAFSLLP